MAQQGRGSAECQYGGASHDFLFHNDDPLQRTYWFSICVGVVIAPTPAFPAPRVLPVVPAIMVVAHAGLVAVAGEVAAVPIVGETVGIVGITEPKVPTVGNTPGTGTAGVELTPRLLISKDPNGIPVRAAPPGVVGDVAVGLDDAAMLLEPEPHIPEVPDVSSIPEDVDIAGDDDVPAFDGVGTPGIASVPESTAVAGVEAPAVVPPPSYIALDPNISAGEVAAVEHAVPLLVVGMEMVPAKPVGAGLTPAEVISVEPNGIPVGELAEPIPMPSGEVAPIVGSGSTVSPTCAIAAALQPTSAEKTAAINDNLPVVLHLKPASSIPKPVNDPERGFAMSMRWPTCCGVAAPVSNGFATSPAGARLFDIGQFLILRWSVFDAWNGWLANAFRRSSIANDHCLVPAGRNRFRH
jgi:hypothetical protein